MTYLNIILVLTVCKVQSPLSMFICHKFPQKLLWYQQISTMQHCREIGGSAQIWCYFHCYKCCHMQVSCFKLTKLIKSKIKERRFWNTFLEYWKKDHTSTTCIYHMLVYPVVISKFLYWNSIFVCIQFPVLKYNLYVTTDITKTWHMHTHTQHSYKYICIQGVVQK